jgi:hypothetical protein
MLSALYSIWGAGRMQLGWESLGAVSWSRTSSLSAISRKLLGLLVGTGISSMHCKISRCQKESSEDLDHGTLWFAIGPISSVLCCSARIFQVHKHETNVLPSAVLEFNGLPCPPHFSVTLI